jgi:hypothetical protein
MSDDDEKVMPVEIVSRAVERREGGSGQIDRGSQLARLEQLVAQQSVQLNQLTYAVLFRLNAEQAAMNGKALPGGKLPTALQGMYSGLSLGTEPNHNLALCTRYLDSTAMF